MRLAKYLAHAGVASRRAAEQIIAAGRVTVGGEVVTDPARDVGPSSGVAVDGRALEPEAPETWVVNKPAGMVSTARDPQGRPKVTDLVDSEARLYPVGRLDADSTGLILLTNDGMLAERLTHPRYGVQKAYRVRVRGRPAEQALEELRKGVRLEDGPAQPAEVRILEAGGAESELEITIREGRKRQVRRMCDAVGHRVLALRRVRIGSLELGGLRPGQARRLRRDELERLWENASR